MQARISNGRGWLVAAAASVLLSPARQARAASPAPAGDRGAHDVAAGCPARSAWEEAVRARLPEALREHPTLRAVDVKVRREPAQQGRGDWYAGRLGSASPGVAGDSREVRGGSCEEVMAALALIAALELQHGPPAKREADSAPAWGLTAEQELELAEEEDALAPAVVPSESERLQWGAVAFGLFDAVAAPRSSVGLGIGATVRWQNEDVQPWFLLGVYSRLAEQVRVPGSTATARIEHISSHAVACPVRIPQSAPAGLRPCLELELGRLTAAGRDVNGAEERSALWASAGLGLRGEWSPWRRLELGAMLGGLLTLSRPRFFFLPDVTALEVPEWGVRAGASASVLF